jgi:glycosyltransferase involved in cell wall biosynthesis
VFAPDAPAAAGVPLAEETAGFLTVLAEAIRRFRPDVVLTYGSDPASRGARSVARRAGAKVAFRLHNFAYPDPTAFADCDAITVPSAFSRDHHRTALGLDCTVVPPVIELSRVLVNRPDRGRFVTFVNPEPNKGVFWFARMAEVLGRERPAVPLLIVEGRSRVDGLAGCGVDLRNVTSLHRLANTPDPRRFYRVTRLTLMPSVWRESFGRVAAESMFNGIPVLASDRGALPEVIGAGGLCLPIPAQLSPETRTPPTADAVRPWVDAVLRLWDDPARYTSMSAAAEAGSRAWHPEIVIPQWEALLTSLAGN